MGQEKARIVIIDDHALLREGVASLINQEDDLEVCGEAKDTSSALKVVEETNPELAIVDISLGRSSGIELVKDLKAIYKDLLILVLSMHDENIYARRVLRAGAHGYLMKSDPAGRVIQALRKILAGGIYLSENMKDIVLQESFHQKSGSEKGLVESLSDRELDIFRMIGDGFKPAEIAQRLSLSVKTIESYRSRLKDKLNLESAPELHRYAVAWMRSHADAD